MVDSNVSPWEVSDDEAGDLMAGRYDVSPEHTVKQANSMMARKLTDLVKNIYDIAMNSPSDKVRLEASKYLVDRVLGRTPLQIQAKGIGEAKAPWEDLYEATVVEPSKYQLES